MAWDASERLIGITFPDGNLATSAYDCLDRVRAVTTPNGNQADTSAINVTNAGNWLQNAGAENPDLFTPSAPRYWSSASSGASRDRSGSHAHSGNASLRPPDLADSSLIPIDTPVEDRCPGRSSR